MEVALQNTTITDKLADTREAQDAPQPKREIEEKTPESKKQNSGADSAEEVPSPPAPMAAAQSPTSPEAALAPA